LSNDNYDQYKQLYEQGSVKDWLMLLRLKVERIQLEKDKQPQQQIKKKK
jgi:hypothetical protein